MASVEVEEIESVELTSSQKDVEKKTRFRWDKDNKIENLIRCLANFKSQMEFQNSVFDADRVKQYEALRVGLANIYANDATLFGPPSAISSPLFSKSDEILGPEERQEKHRLLKQRDAEKNLIKKGYHRVQEKIKEMRQNFSVAVTTGRRSGSGKVILEFYDELVQIWGCSPATQPLSCGISTDQVNNVTTTPAPSCLPDDANTELGDDDDVLFTSFEDTIHDALDRDTTQNNSGQSSNKKRKPENPLPKLIDNKRRNMERQLSAAQRDQLLLTESKEDAQFKRDITMAIRQSNSTFENSMQQMSSSIIQVAQSLSQSMEIMSRGFMQQNNPNVIPPQHIGHVLGPPQHLGHVIGPTHINYGIHPVSNSELNHENVNDNWTYKPL
jgi:hypothetical protein